ncbi:MAG: DNA polymerase III subunit delta [Armatimonadetes bacterium]|nr:DNA polymerase III subunit delta [Armatimonadota bacterium]
MAVRAANAGSSGDAGGPRAVLLWGAEEEEKRCILARLIEERVAPENRDLDVEYLDATSPGFTADTVIQAARDRAMFSERRVVVVYNAQRFRDRRTQGVQDALATALPRLPDYATVIFVARHVEERDSRPRAPVSPSLIKAIRHCGQEVLCGPARPPDLAQRAQAEARALGKRFLPAALTELIQRAGPGAAGVIQEVHKLVAYAGERVEITADDVRQLLPPRPDDNIFHLLDAAAAGKRVEALALLRQLLAAGEPPSRILFWLRRTLRELLQAKFVQEHGISHVHEADQLPAGVAAALPREGNLYVSARQVWKRKNLWLQAGRFSWEQLRAAFDRLCLAEAGLKGWERGVENPELALEVLVIRLCSGEPAAGER